MSWQKHEKRATIMRSPFVCFLNLLRELRSKLASSWLNQNGAIGENNRWHASHTTTHTYHIICSFVVLFDIDIFIGYAMRIEPAFRHAAITAPRGGIQFDRFFVARFLVC